MGISTDLPSCSHPWAYGEWEWTCRAECHQVSVCNVILTYFIGSPVSFTSTSSFLRLGYICVASDLFHPFDSHLQIAFTINLSVNLSMCLLPTCVSYATFGVAFPPLEEWEDSFESFPHTILPLHWRGMFHTVSEHFGNIVSFPDPTWTIVCCLYSCLSYQSTVCTRLVPVMICIVCACPLQVCLHHPSQHGCLFCATKGDWWEWARCW